MKPVERQASPQSAKARRSVAAAAAMHGSAMMTHSVRTIGEICKYTGLTPEIIKASFIEHGVTEDRIKQLYFNYTPPKVSAGAGQLSRREQEIIMLLKLGKPNNLIAHDLKITTASVKVHTRNILKKLNFNSLREFNRLYTPANAAEIQTLTSKEIDIIKSLVSGVSNKEISQRLGLSESNVKAHVKSALRGKKSGRTKAALLIAPSPIDDKYGLYNVDVEKSAPNLYHENLHPIEKIINELADWDQETLILLAEKAANGDLKGWLCDQNRRTNELSDSHPRATDPGMIVSPQGSDASGQREPSKLQSNQNSPPDGQMYAARADRKENAPAFIERVYGKAGWLNGEFTRADLRKIDPAAEMALRNWEHSRQRRADLLLPTKQQVNDRLIASGAPIETGDRRETERRRAAAWRRQHRNP